VTFVKQGSINDFRETAGQKLLADFYALKPCWGRSTEFDADSPAKPAAFGVSLSGAV